MSVTSSRLFAVKKRAAVIAGAMAAAGLVIAGSGAAHAVPDSPGPGTLVTQTAKKAEPRTPKKDREQAEPGVVAPNTPAPATTDQPEKKKTPAEPDYTTILKPGPPITVSNAEYSYIATHAVTKQLKRANVAGGIATLPVPAQYRRANDGLSFQFRRALAGALSTPGGCIQIVVSRGHAGSLFDYGLFAIDGRYCD